MTKHLRQTPLQPEFSETLDPASWDELRAQGHRMLDDMIDFIASVRERPVWQPIPDAVPPCRFAGGLCAFRAGREPRDFADERFLHHDRRPPVQGPFLFSRLHLHHQSI